MRHLESRIQIACVRWFMYEYPQYAGLLFHVPNGGYRKKTTAIIMKQEGVVSGVADLILLVPNKDSHGLCIEMKTEKGRQSDNQKVWQFKVTEQGYQYEVVRSVEQFIDVINAYLG